MEFRSSWEDLMEIMMVDDTNAIDWMLEKLTVHQPFPDGLPNLNIRSNANLSSDRVKSLSFNKCGFDCPQL